jgi:hypothetical protein
MNSMSSKPQRFGQSRKCLKDDEWTDVQFMNSSARRMASLVCPTQYTFIGTVSGNPLPWAGTFWLEPSGGVAPPSSAPNRPNLELKSIDILHNIGLIDKCSDVKSQQI